MDNKIKKKSNWIDPSGLIVKVLDVGVWLLDVRTGKKYTCDYNEFLKNYKPEEDSSDERQAR